MCPEAWCTPPHDTADEAPDTRPGGSWRTLVGPPRGMTDDRPGGTWTMAGRGRQWGPAVRPPLTRAARPTGRRAPSRPASTKRLGAEPPVAKANGYRTVPPRRSDTGEPGARCPPRREAGCVPGAPGRNPRTLPARRPRASVHRRRRGCPHAGGRATGLTGGYGGQGRSARAAAAPGSGRRRPGPRRTGQAPRGAASASGTGSPSRRRAPGGQSAGPPSSRPASPRHSLQREQGTELDTRVPAHRSPREQEPPEAVAPQKIKHGATWPRKPTLGTRPEERRAELKRDWSPCAQRPEGGAARCHQRTDG